MKDLTKGNVTKNFILFAIPMVLSGLLSQAYATINTVMAGKLLGDSALAVTGALAPLQTFLDSLFWGYGMGLGIHVSQLFGAKDYRKLKSVIISNLTFLSAVIFLLSVLLIVFRYSIFQFLKVDPVILKDCSRYFVVIELGKVLILFVANCAAVMAALGESMVPMLLSSLSAILNICVGFVSVAVLHMGVEGLAVGSITGATVSTTLYCLQLRKVFQKLEVVREKTPFSFKIVGQTCRYALITMFQQSVMYFAGLVLSPMVNSIGAAASASYTVALRVYNINSNIYINSSKVVGSYTAQCYGGKQYDRLKNGVGMGVVQSLILVAPFLLVSSLLARGVAMAFFPSDADPVSVEYAVWFLRYCMPLLVLNVFANLFHNFFRGIGRMRALLLTTATGTLARIVVSWILIVPFGIYGYYVGWVISWLADGAVGAGIYFFGKWRKTLQ